MKTKNLFLFSLLASSFLFSACQTINPVLDNAKSTLSQNILTKKIDKLDIDTIMKSAYPKTVSEPMAYVEPKALDEYFRNYPSRQIEANVLGFIHPTIEYKNIQGELRYLVIVEKVKIYDGYIQSCRACRSQLDLFIYKKQNGQFQLINSARDQNDIPSGDGHLQSDFNDQFMQNFQRFGRNITGSYMRTTYTGAGGQEESVWYVVLLPDIGQLKIMSIASGGGSTENYYADRPEMASVITSTLRVQANQADYYPIEVIYTDTNTPKTSKKIVLQYALDKGKYVEMNN
ncbi:hypothetical protein F4V57_03390 [Acinetobacter qingfengensis]|uniref:Lipoprotein n=1 Tax=Acinetobacter qingfengensis TaxID=1262585 RepID=A0A1E7R3H9_9GAMM|nr:hypothetical protein [Acinetobacter qingfengensis]KAA8734817.1 hypothetical protein F4V57_03390 [Acinetobacter qingfengensis]OEY93813.1 hypothetical protein BJI46_13985 [Acinetobacter qingfengensis]